MKKLITVVLILIMMAALTGCGKGGNGRSGAAHKLGGSKSVNDVLNEGMKKEDQKKNGRNGSTADIGAPTQSGLPDSGADSSVVKAEGVDVDLSTMSSTLVYAEVYNIVNEPEKYIGKTIKMSGTYAYTFDDEGKKRYDACIIQDATACCGGGIEFELTGDYKYPEDYPEEGGNICVVGVFDTYVEGEYTYCTLRNAKKTR